MYNIKKVIIICLIALLVVIPTAYASNNQTDFELNDNILSDSYYFDANVDVSGNGSLNSPYKTLRNNVHDDSVIYLNEGIYSGYSIEVNNITIIGKSSENTIIKNMNIKDKLRLGICLSTSDWADILYNKSEMYEKFDTMLKEIDEEYRTTLINFAKYKLVMFAMAKLIEMEITEQNKGALYLFNNIKI